MKLGLRQKQGKRDIELFRNHGCVPMPDVATVGSTVLAGLVPNEMIGEHLKPA